MPLRFVAKQLSHPKGLVGHGIARLMNRMNAGMSAHALGQLDVRPTDHVLEIGFGGGVALRSLMPLAACVCGLDRSQDMVRSIRRRYRAKIAATGGRFLCGSVEQIPFASASFDRVLSVNTIYFWRPLEAGVAEIHRVLRPGGRVAIGFLPAEGMAPMNMPADIFTLRDAQALSAVLAAAGFCAITLRQPRPGVSWRTLVATRPSA